MRAVAVIMISVCMVVSSALAEQRRVIAEMFTATWCAPCGRAREAIDSLAHELGPDSLVVLEYHVSDALAIPEGDERGHWYIDPDTFYIPNMWFDGTINEVGAGSVSEAYNTYRLHIEDRLAIPSPLTLTPGFSMGETEGEVSVKIEVVESFSETELKVYFVVYENEVGADDYNYVVRDILPPEDLTIASVGDSVQIERSFQLDPDWHIEQIGIGIFVQSYDSKNVLQASRVEPWMLYPNLSLDDFSISDSLGNSDGRADPGDTVQMTVTLFNHGGFQDADSISVTLATDDSSLVFLDSVAFISHIPAGSTGTNQDDLFEFRVLACSSHWANFHLTIHAQPNDYSAETGSFKILIGRPKLIVIDDDEGADYERYYFSALDSLGFLYDCSNWLPFEPYLEVQKYETVIWLTGDDSVATLTQQDIDSLESFLDNGGNLFISGQNIGYDIASNPFYSDYLHAQRVGTASGDYFISGVPGDEIGDGLSFVILGAGGASNQTSQDIIRPVDGADSILVYSGGGVAAVKYGGTYKVVYFGFGFEAINNLVLGWSHRPECLKEILNWFGYSITGVAENVRIYTQESSWIRVSPNPFEAVTTISYSLPQNTPVTLRVYDSSGRYLQTLADGKYGPGVSFAEWNGRDFRGERVPSGVYFLRLENPYGMLTRKIVYLR